MVSPSSSPSDRGRQGCEKFRNKQSIHHFHIDHNAPCSPPPQKKKLCITIVFDFSWDDCNTLENLETMVVQNSEGENKVHYSLYESSDYKRCKACVKYLTDNLVPRSPRSCAGLRKWRLRDWPTRRAQEGPLKLPDERQSLKRRENCRRLLLPGIQTGDKLAKPPFFVTYSRLCRHCRNLAGGGCRLSQFHFRLCRYFLGHVAYRNLPWQGLFNICPPQ